MAETQPKYNIMLKDGSLTEIRKGRPTYAELKETCLRNKQDGGTLILFDDALDICSSEDIAMLFVQGSHHLGCSVMLVSQSLFFQSNQFRTMSLNTQYLCLMRNIRDNRQVVTLASQIAPYRSSYVVSAYQAATRNNPFSYLLFDFSQKQSDSMRLRSNIFMDQFPPVAFLQNSDPN